MYRIKNTAEDRTKHLLHRTATKFELEPTLGGIRIRLGAFLDITDEHYERVKPVVDEWVKKGMVEVIQNGSDSADLRKFTKEPEYDANGLRLDGPTLETWVKAGYQADTYPPAEYAEVPSPGLTAFRMEQDRLKQEIADLAAAAIKEELNRPSTISQILPAVHVEPEVLPEPTVIVAPEPTPAVISQPPVSAPPPFTKQDQNKNKKLR